MKNVLILTYWSYPDALIQTYTLPYVRILKNELPPGSSIYLLTLEKNKETTTGVKKSIIESKLKEEGIVWIPFHYKPFGLSALLMWFYISLKLCALIIRKKISFIHCWCTPAGAIGYFYSLLLNRKLVIDSYEPHAEAMVENGTWKKSGIAFQLLFWLEKKQTQRAQYIISATAGMQAYAREKYNVSIRNFLVKPACVDLNQFNFYEAPDESLRSSLGLKNKIVCVYAGKFGGIYFDHEVFDFIKIAIDHWGDSFRFLILTSHSAVEVNGYCYRAGVDINHIVMRFVPHQEIQRYLKLADFALTPVRPVPTKRFCTPIKDGEYWALGLPVVISENISDDSEIIEKNNIGFVLKAFNQDAYHQAVLKIDELRKQPDVRNRIREIAQQYRSFDIALPVYKKVYNP